MTPAPSPDPEPTRCGNIMVGSGTDTYDPTCDLPDGHEGVCKSYSATDQNRLADPESTVCPTCHSDDPATIDDPCGGFHPIDPFHVPPETAELPRNPYDLPDPGAGFTETAERFTIRYCDECGPLALFSAKDHIHQSICREDRERNGGRLVTHPKNRLIDVVPESRYEKAQEQLGHWYQRALAAESRYEKAKEELERIIDHADKHKVAGILAVIDQARLTLANLETEGE